MLQKRLREKIEEHVLNNMSKNIPNHIAIIMDGNRRWANNKKLPVLAGHKYALDKIVEELIEEAGNSGVKYLTLWAWSTENWQRKKDEVSGILKLMSYAIRSKVNKFNKKGAKLNVIGDVSKFPKDLQRGIDESIEKTKENKKITVTFALNYGGRDEILRAIKKIPPSQSIDLNAQTFSAYLDTAKMPDPDIIIRTGGEKRLSGFMSWQAEYAELYFTDVLFPDFNTLEFQKALTWYADRKRRFGK